MRIAIKPTERLLAWKMPVVSHLVKDWKITCYISDDCHLRMSFFGISPKRGRYLAEKKSASRRERTGISPKRQWCFAEKASLLRRRSDDGTISGWFWLDVGPFSVRWSVKIRMAFCKWNSEYLYRRPTFLFKPISIIDLSPWLSIGEWKPIRDFPLFLIYWWRMGEWEVWCAKVLFSIHRVCRVRLFGLYY